MKWNVPYKTHPGDVRREEFTAPPGPGARDPHVAPNRISAIVSQESPRAA